MTNEEIWTQVLRYFEARDENDFVTMAEAATNIELSLAAEEVGRYQVNRQ